ncbi:MAG: SprT-like domain-containing protein [Brevinemataceae bacterium]
MTTQYSDILEKCLKEINNKYFHFTDLPEIKLSKGQDKTNKKNITFGTYHAKKNEIKIHPILLKPNVPLTALEFVIYHEMLHFEDRDSLLIRRKGQKVHTIEFRKREKMFYQYNEAKKMLKDILYERVDQNMKEICEKSPRNTKQNQKRQSGEELENALIESLKNLDYILAKYYSIETRKKGATNGSKKTNDKIQLDSHA